MAYASDVVSINSYIDDLNEIYNSLNSVDFTTCWEGNAQAKQKSNLDEILTAIKEQIDNCSNLANALLKIDEYDEAKSIIDGYTSQMNRLNPDSSDYSNNYNYLYKLRDNVISSKNKLKVEIDNLFSQISNKYTSILTDITPVNIINTVDIFKD